MLDVARLSAAPLVDRVAHSATIDSTNAEARRKATDLDPGERWLFVAEAQTAGRGRGANAWWTGAGSLAFSLLFDPRRTGVAPAQLPMLPLAAALALVEALAADAAPHELGIHWPNDVFLAGRKLAGVLVEGLGDGRVILGLGVNVNNRLAAAPTDVQRRAVTLCELLGREFDRTQLLCGTLAQLQANCRQLAETPELLARRGHALCLQRGRELLLETGAERVRGRCLGISDEGALLLETESGVQTHYSGALVHETGC